MKHADERKPGYEYFDDGRQPRPIDLQAVVLNHNDGEAIEIQGPVVTDKPIVIGLGDDVITLFPDARPITSMDASQPKVQPMNTARTLAAIVTLIGCVLLGSAAIQNLTSDTSHNGQVAVGVVVMITGILGQLSVNSRRRVLILAAAVLFTSPAYAGQTEIAFETIVTLDKFRITNQSTIAHLNRIYLRPSAELTLTVSDPEMLLADTPPWPGDDRVGWFVNRWHPGRWVEFSGTIDPSSTLDVEFVEPTPRQERGYIFAPVESGTFRGFTVPEPGTWAMGLVGLAIACYVAVKRQRALGEANTVTCTPPT